MATHSKKTNSKSDSSKDSNAKELRAEDSDVYLVSELPPEAYMNNPSDESLSGAETSAHVPPQDIDAERCLLGSIMLNDEIFPEILETVKVGDFYEKRHNVIYRAMENLYNSSNHIDLTTLTAELRNLGVLKEIGGAPYLAELSNTVLTASHATSYANIVEQTCVRRRLIAAGTEIINAAYKGSDDVSTLLGHAEKQLFGVSDQTIKSDYTPLSELLVDAFNRLELLQKNKNALRGLKTGFPDIDKKTAGFQKGDLIILGARPAMGKTTLAQNFAYNISSFNKCAVLFFSMEMPKSQIVDRMISDVASINNWNIRTGNITADEFVKVGDALGEMGENQILIDDTSSMTILEIRNKARRAKHDHPDLGLIIIDYLQLIRGTDRYAGNRVQELTEISRGLKTLARELEIPVIALAQLNRKVTDHKRDDPRPTLSDIRDSGSIEQDADLVMFLHRPDYYHQNEDNYVPTNITELLFAKHRNGSTGKVELYFNPDYMRFTSLDKTHEE